MLKFKYEGYDKNSVAKFGTLEAENLSDAYNALQFQGVTVVNLEVEKSGTLKFFAENFLRLQLDGKWQAVFFRELSVMLGVMNVHDAILSLKKSSTESHAQKIFDELFQAVENGETFSAALKRYEVVFGSDTIQSVEIAETSGKLQEVTAQISNRLEQSYTTERKVRSALFYPVTVLAAAIIAAVIMIKYTLPVFETFYSEQGGELPLITLILLRGGNFLTDNLVLILIFLVATIFLAVIIYREVEGVKLFFDKLKWQIKIFREIELRNLFGRLSFLLESGITLNDAVKMCSQSSGNLFVKNFLDEVKSSVERGENFGSALKKFVKNFSALYLGLIVTGEESGELTEMLKQCESMADFEIEEMLRGLPAKAEVYGTLTAGVIVGALVFSIILPILNMTNLF